jgi:hypothetical protein
VTAVPGEPIERAEVERLLGLELGSVTVMTGMIELLFIRYPWDASAYEMRIDIEAGFEIERYGEVQTATQQQGMPVFMAGASMLIGLIQNTVAAASLGSDSSLDLQFSDRTRLRILVSEDGFTSYHLIEIKQAKGPARSI